VIRPPLDPPAAASTSAAPAAGTAHEPAAGAQAAPHPRRPWRIVGYIAIALLVVALGAGALYYTSRPNAPTFKVNECVQRSGDGAIAASCSAPGAYRVVSRVANRAQCPDKSQPYVLLQNVDPATAVVCLRPAR
jgi:hypothetical protein